MMPPGVGNTSSEPAMAMPDSTLTNSRLVPMVRWDSSVALNTWSGCLRYRVTPFFHLPRRLLPGEATLRCVVGDGRLDGRRWWGSSEPISTAGMGVARTVALVAGIVCGGSDIGSRHPTTTSPATMTTPNAAHRPDGCILLPSQASYRLRTQDGGSSRRAAPAARPVPAPGRRGRSARRCSAALISFVACRQAVSAVALPRCSG